MVEVAERDRQPYPEIGAFRYLKEDETRHWRTIEYIPRGTLILTEAPLFSLPTSPSADQVGTIMGALPDVIKAYIRGLKIAPQYNGTEAPQSDDQAKILSNALRQGTSPASQQGVDTEMIGIFPNALKFHQSCVPEVHYHWTGTCMEFRTMQDLQPGIPVSISFDVPRILSEHVQRGQWLWQFRGVQCHCRICTSTHSQKLESDARRSLASSIIWNGPKDTNQAKEAIHALEKEGLHLFQDTLAYDGYLQFSRDPSIEARNNAVLWLQHAHQLARSYVGENDQRVRTMARRLGL